MEKDDVFFDIGCNLDTEYLCATWLPYFFIQDYREKQAPMVSTSTPDHLVSTATKRSRPDFFMVGAPKCATTSMTHYLVQHPEIFLQKSMYFFGSDISDRKMHGDIDAYLDKFQAGKGKVCGERSVDYLYSKRAACEIYAFNPQAKIIIMVRNPIDFIPSMHSHNLWRLEEDIENLEEALAAEPDRKQGKRIPHKCLQPEMLLYTEVARFSEQIERYIDVFTRDRVHIIVYNDMKHDPASVYRNTLIFLGVDPTFQPEFTISNPNKSPRSKTVSAFLKHPPAPVYHMARTLMPKPIRRTLMSIIRYRLNARYQQRPPMDHALRKRLQAQFAPEVERLSALIGCDLTYWNKSS